MLIILILNKLLINGPVTIQDKTAMSGSSGRWQSIRQDKNEFIDIC